MVTPALLVHHHHNLMAGVGWSKVDYRNNLDRNNK